MNDEAPATKVCCACHPSIADPEVISVVSARERQQLDADGFLRPHRDGAAGWRGRAMGDCQRQAARRLGLKSGSCRTAICHRRAARSFEAGSDEATRP